MALWIELHCDALVSGSKCYAVRRPGDFGAKARNTSAIRLTLLFIERDAAERGWMRIKRKWYCPSCAAVLKANT